ncbi:MAG: hypothetical protein QGG64_11755, partial [Candidatus Latescibacteria bacterium]|nr:hypothetical protein [Candidatus Latescibacterota bacterium]
LYSCVLEVDGAYRLYYKAKNWSPSGEGPYRSTTINLAQSDDALCFEKRPFPESVCEGTNIVLNDAIDDYTIVLDEKDPDPDRRYKLLSSRGNWREGLTPATSSDGLQWIWGKPHAVRYFGDRMSYWYDPVREQHVAWSRNLKIHPKRIVVESTSEDFESWSYPRIAMMTNSLDHPESQIYGSYGFWYESLYLAYVEIYEVAHQRLHTQLASSRDGENWQRLCDNDVFLPCGDHGAFDTYWIVPTFNPPVVAGGKMLIHYGGRPDPHKQANFEHVPPGMGGALGLSELRVDGFVSLDATGRPGTVQTHPMNLDGEARFLNVNVCPFNQRPGYEPMDVEVSIDGAGSTRMWKIEPDDSDPLWYQIDLGEPTRGAVSLTFRLKNARLYSFKFTD